MVDSFTVLNLVVVGEHFDNLYWFQCRAISAYANQHSFCYCQLAHTIPLSQIIQIRLCKESAYPDEHTDYDTHHWIARIKEPCHDKD
jgi:hypothetical protein